MTPRPRILYYSHTRQVSGGERVLLLMLQALDRTRYEPLCACPFEGRGDLDDVLRAHGEQVLEAPILQARFTSNPLKLARYLASFFGAIRTFRKTIVNANPDLLHANSVRAGIVATLATLGTRTLVLWHLHDDLPAHPISAIIRQLAFRSRRSRFVAVSHATARVFADGLPFGYRLQVLHNAVDTTRFPRQITPLDAAAQAFRKEIGVAAKQILVVAVGMINLRKGQLELIDAWSEMVEMFEEPRAAEMRLAIVGAPLFNDDHLYQAKLEARIEELKLGRNVVLTGPSSDVPAVLRAVDLLVLNAKVEPFGLVLLESISSGTSVLATRVGGIPEIVDHLQSGWLILPPAAPGQNACLAQGLLRATRIPRALVDETEYAFQNVLPQFTSSVFAANLQALYTSLNLGGGPA